MRYRAQGSNDGGARMKRFLALLVVVPGSALAQPPAAGLEPFGTPCPCPSCVLHAGVERKTVISYRGTKDGKITDAELAKSSRYYSLDDAAMVCVGHWHFDPSLPSAAALIGPHRATIQWRIPFTAPETPPKPPVGRLVDPPLRRLRRFHREPRLEPDGRGANTPPP